MKVSKRQCFGCATSYVSCEMSKLQIFVVQFYPWFKFYFPLFLSMVMYDNKLETEKNKF